VESNPAASVGEKKSWVEAARGDQELGLWQGGRSESFRKDVSFEKGAAGSAEGGERKKDGEKATASSCQKEPFTRESGSELGT